MKSRKSHSEAVSAALAEVARLHAAGLSVTPSSVARGASISRSNLYHREGARNDGWSKVVRAMTIASENSSAPAVFSRVRGRDAELKELHDRIARFDDTLLRLEKLSSKTFRSLLDNYIQFWKKDRDRCEEKSQLAALLEEVTASRRHNKELETTLRLLSAGHEPRQDNYKVSHLSKKIIISPDTYMLDENGVYTFSKHRANEAWQKAILEVDEQLRLRVPSTILVLVGPQGAGKSTWAAQHRPSVPGISLYFDATLPFSADRSALVVRARRVGVKVVCIRFLTPLEQCIKNCTLREPERHVQEKLVRTVFNVFEEITVDEGFDEIHLIRSGQSSGSGAGTAAE
ncbi:hypothetical protein AB4876_10230 [Zhongshania guokunii]|uniref:Uncharacterized protein n=1 Tax=Zhongshania guokunii TaxID=641783 RepID=A0ABV3U726_9GAMM